MLRTILSSSIIIPDLRVKKQLVRLQIRVKQLWTSWTKQESGDLCSPFKMGKTDRTTPESRHKDGVSQGNTPKVSGHWVTVMSVLRLSTTQDSHASVTIQVLWPSLSIQHHSPFILAKEPKTSNPRPQHHLHYFFKQHYLLKLSLNITSFIDSFNHCLTYYMLGVQQ